MLTILLALAAGLLLGLILPQRPSARAKVYFVDSAEWGRLLRERKARRGWRAQKADKAAVGSDSQDS